VAGESSRRGHGPLQDVARVLAFVLPLAAVAARAQDTPDPMLGTVPFERWMIAGDHTQIPWKVTVSPATLDNHQRLKVTIGIAVEGKEIVKRARGQFRILLQFNDEQGGVYEDHGILELKDVTARVRSQGFYYTHSAFLRPGDYRVGIALVDTATREHSFARRTIHVDEIKDDPLPLAWNAIAPVEILAHDDAPEAWYLPYVAGRLSLSLSTARLMRLDLLMNLPAEDASATLYRNSMGALLPAFKALYQLGGQTALVNAAVLDLTRQRVSFEQAQGRDLDWTSLKNSLGLANPNVIDVHSLGNRGKSVEFFLSEINRRMDAGVKWRSETHPRAEISKAADTGEEAKPPREAGNAVVILSGPMMFPKGTEMHQIQPEEGADCPVFYIRYHTPLERRVVQYLTTMPANMNNRTVGPPVKGRSSGAVQSTPQATTVTATAVDPFSPEEADALENTLKPLHPKLFDVTTPEEFRKALAEIIDQLGRSSDGSAHPASRAQSSPTPQP